MSLTALEFAFLEAAHELSLRQAELYPSLTEALGREPYAFWVRRHERAARNWFERLRFRADLRRFQSGRFQRWAWGFHGLECDLRHLDDGRFVRIDFGPSTRHLVLTGWGVLQFVMTSRPPWRSFHDLREFLADEPPPYHHLSGDHAKMSALCDRLQELELLVPAEPRLLTDRRAGSADVSDAPFDSYLARRLVLSPAARELVQSAAPPGVAADE